MKYTTDKPCSYESYFSNLNHDEGKPSYALGVTFGVDLEIWRVILKSIFGKEFNEKQEFNKACLFTDKVSYIDSNLKRDLLHNKLVVMKPKVDGYLHTKFVLLQYEDKFRLIVFTKNIQSSTSFDCIFPLVGECKEKESNCNGKRIAEYIEYLVSKSQNKYPMGLDIDSLKKCSFTSEYHGWKLNDIQFAYGKKRFEPDLWNKVISSNCMISPFLDDGTIQEIQKKRGSHFGKTKILAYPDHIEKITDKSGISFYMGKVEERKSDIFQYRFHAKLYLNDDKKSMIMGSANLTQMAKNVHCEMLLELCANDEPAYQEVKAVFDEEKLIEEYNKAHALVMDYDLDNDQDEGEACGTLPKYAKIYVLRNGNGHYEMHVIDTVNHVEVDKIWGQPYENAVFYIQYNDKMIYIEREKYLEDELVKKIQGGYTYSEYEALVKKYLIKFCKENDDAIFKGRKSADFPSQNMQANDSSNRGKTKQLEEIPCLYHTIFQMYEDKWNERKRNKKANHEIDKELLKEVLEELLEKIYEPSNIEMVNSILEKC